jgi:hypothetical protein
MFLVPRGSVDWQRHAFHLPVAEAHRLWYCLTDVQRTVRGLCDEAGRKRGRPLLLTVRVAGSIAQSMRQGYDVEAWLEEGLVDVLVPAGNAGTDDSIDIGEWKALAARCAKGSTVHICPGTDSGDARGRTRRAGAAAGQRDAQEPRAGGALPGAGRRRALHL